MSALMRRTCRLIFKIFFWKYSVSRAMMGTTTITSRASCQLMASITAIEPMT